MNDLTDGMKKALVQVGFGVRKYHDGKYRQIDDTNIIVDGRSLQALHTQRLINWNGLGGVLHQIHLSLTERGESLFEELRQK